MGTGESPRAVVNGRRILLNDASLQLLGRPDRVALLFDPETRDVGMEPATAKTKRPFFIDPDGRIFAAWFLRKHHIVGGSFEVSSEPGGMIVFGVGAPYLTLGDAFETFA